VFFDQRETVYQEFADLQKILQTKMNMKHSECYDSSYASMLIAMLMTMLMIMFLTIVDCLSLDYQVVSKSILFRISLCSSESYR